MQPVRQHSAAPARAWRTLREALDGSHQDYTSGSEGRAILLLAIPMVLEMVMESVFAVCDIFFVSKLGAAAVATVGLTESMLAIVYAIAIGLCIGAAAIVARRIGEGDADGAARASVQVLGLGLIVAAAIGVVGGMAAPHLLAGMGASAEVIAVGTPYTRVMLGGCASIIMLFLANALFRGAGDAAIAMRSLWLANGINILLAPALIFGVGPLPELGVMGAAVGTTIGRSVGALYSLSHLARDGSRLRVRRHHLVVERAVMARVLSLSSTATVQSLIATSSWIGLVRILSTFGSEALAGYTVGIRVVMFALLPSWGLSNAAATMVGQSLGAGKPDRAERSVWLAARYNMWFLGAVGVLFVAFAPAIAGFFTNDPEVVRHATLSLRTIAAGFLFYAYGMVLTQSFNGAGDTMTPTLLNLVVFWLWEIPLAYLLALRLGLGPFGVYLSIAIAFSTLAIVSAVLFKRGRWKEKAV